MVPARRIRRIFAYKHATTRALSKRIRFDTDVDFGSGLHGTISNSCPEAVQQCVNLRACIKELAICKVIFIIYNEIVSAAGSH
jgi:hypothetical protein